MVSIKRIERSGYLLLPVMKKREESSMENHRRQQLCILLITLFSFFSCMSIASFANDFSLNGVILNQAKTRLGYDFYHFFSSSWESPETTEFYTIVLYEQASPKFGSLVDIKVNDQLVERIHLNRRSKTIEDVAKKATRRVSRYVAARFSGQSGQQNSVDLSGSGF